MSQEPIFEALEFERLDEAEQLRRSREFLRRITRRRSVRDFSSQPVALELIENAIRVAGSAPSGANQQPWTFAVVSDPALKKRMRLAAEAEEKDSYERRMSQEWLDALAPLGTDWRKPHIEDAPYVIVVFRQAYGIAADGRRIKHYYSEESVGIAVGLLLAALHWSGLATLTHTPSPMKFLARLLGRPANERAFVLIPVGYPADDAQVPAISKKRLDEILLRR
ncbi:MAG: nitroreductase family protein [Chloroflexi bacterium]|nr:nitroreductase family protein [Chloroflexota bacterium]MCY3717402.1 nitroreductase family protein [Chloroflexota bacterium]MXV93090.1 nitroreductase family protein [Chloroflexota bacterium]MXX83900.1 nitroreductase family protein [Chloroflexota bacterium]MYA92957.1 nitroreductase family protein [Chloroflexota bacterium]